MKLKELLNGITLEQSVENKIVIHLNDNILPFKEWRFHLLYEIKKVVYLGDKDKTLNIYL